MNTKPEPVRPMLEPERIEGPSKVADIVRRALVRWGLACGTCGLVCDCPASIRPRQLERLRIAGPVPYHEPDLLTIGAPVRVLATVGDRMTDDGAPVFGVTPAGRLPARPTPPRVGDAAAELRGLVPVLEDLLEHGLAADRPGLRVALAQVQAAGVRAGVL